ncbi:HIT family protein [Bacillus cereus]|uniref:HIT family protein n=1 Tax=Bacillus cereus TaxID=1396 RepID=UPI00397F7411
MKRKVMDMSTNNQIEQNCFICEKHKGNIIVPGGAIYEDELVYVGHVPGLAELTDEEAKAFGLITSRVSKALKESEGAEHIYTFVSGNGVPHMHMHIIPRYPNTPKEFWSPSEIAKWTGAPYGDAAKIKKLCERIREYMVSEYAYNK